MQTVWLVLRPANGAVEAFEDEHRARQYASTVRGAVVTSSELMNDSAAGQFNSGQWLGEQEPAPTAPRVDVVTYVGSEGDVVVDVFIDGAKQGDANVWDFEWDTGRDPVDIDEDLEAVVQADGMPEVVRERCMRLIGYQRDAVSDEED
jgi:hypothetical protein